jgi:predicted RNA binding protein YcfA (HicA-like mRNA interferase family)
VAKLPRVSGAEVVRTLTSLGFVVARQRGSHIVMRRGATGCVVPNHRELKTGTLIGVLNQAGVTPEKFIEAYRRNCTAIDQATRYPRIALGLS